MLLSLEVLQTLVITKHRDLLALQVPATGLEAVDNGIHLFVVNRPVVLRSTQLSGDKDNGLSALSMVLTESSSHRIAAGVGEKDVRECGVREL
jgi:hypothetical protein